MNHPFALMNRAATSLLLLLATCTFLRAQIPQTLNYQGRISVNGINFPSSGASATGKFKFALVSKDGNTTYWSNDGANPPIQEVPLTVTGGLYSVALGDTTLSNMIALPASVFTNSDLNLRIWFDDGTSHGLQLLGPDQRLTAAPYAATASSVTIGAITAPMLAAEVLQQLLPVGTILPYGGVTAPPGFLLCNGASLSRSGQYANLFGVLGAAYGASDGTTFNVPDLRGRFLRGVDAGAGHDPDAAERVAMAGGGNTGDKVGALQSDALQGHVHALAAGIAFTTIQPVNGSQNDFYSDFSYNAGNQVYTYANGIHTSGPISDGINGIPRTTGETRPVNVSVNYIIKY